MKIISCAFIIELFFTPNITSVSKVRLQTHAVIVLIFYSVSSFPAPYWHLTSVLVLPLFRSKI